MAKKNENRIEWKSVKGVDVIDGLKIDYVYYGYVGELMMFQIYLPKHFPKKVIKILFPYFHQKMEYPIITNDNKEKDITPLKEEAEKILLNFIKILLGDEISNPNSPFIL